MKITNKRLNVYAQAETITRVGGDASSFWGACCCCCCSALCSVEEERQK